MKKEHSSITQYWTIKTQTKLWDQSRGAASLAAAVSHIVNERNKHSLEQTIKVDYSVVGNAVGIETYII